MRTMPYAALAIGHPERRTKKEVEPMRYENGTPGYRCPLAALYYAMLAALLVFAGLVVMFGVG